MSPKSCVVVFAAVSAAGLVAASAQTSGAREYFFLGAQKKDTLAPMRAEAVVHKTSQPVNKPLAAGAVHLGLRYNLLLVDEATNKSEMVDPDRDFKPGECFAIQFSSNRSGYLYVTAIQSSGTAMALLPSPQMKGESNRIDPGQTIRVPQNHCFEIGNPPGDENLFVALSRDPAETYKLQQDSEGASPDQQPKQAEAASNIEMADARELNNEVQHLTERFASRDIAIVKTGAQPASADEPAHAVYVVDESPKPTSTIVAHIVVHHRDSH